MADSNRGYTKLLNLTDEELMGTLCLEPRFKDGDSQHTAILNCQSDRFLGALFDSRTSFEFKSKEIFHIVEPQYVEYKQFAVKLKLRNHPTNTLCEKDIKDIRVYLDGCIFEHCFTVLMKPDLNISQVLTYLNKFDTALKSDREIDDYTSKINSERLPRFLIAVETPEFFRIFCKLLNFYSNTIEARANYTARPQELIGKVIQKQNSKHIDIKGTIPHRNCVYFFQKKNEYKGFFESCFDFERAINKDCFKRLSNAYGKIDFDNPDACDDMYFTVYDMKTGNDEIKVSSNENTLEEDPELPKYSRY
ncbi:hypothetical protein BN7_6781 [Wickerhamomyces ciferrii]|uniref:Uncharacterized protein n=1 Tax=Wickerhamomyces ciferrii (strain ATCC 14091 / BCRC 22168 / CBS 111 / JCM 3599 / NBRC 0793 / NRRL Y-1031 F-60-10) TaxID=1206466 RepID=K0KVA4_WICCF|nr:uncharacterized protein BN7_6781 [Wickerhamomyces ciferrii]CCH47161.1 hypothetical protein BN7_6781 [Wickerhamomyces ciferrii]